MTEEEPINIPPARLITLRPETEARPDIARRIQRKMQEHAERELEKALHGGFTRDEWEASEQRKREWASRRHRGFVHLHGIA